MPPPRYFGEIVVKIWRYFLVYRQCKAILDEMGQSRKLLGAYAAVVSV